MHITAERSYTTRKFQDLLSSTPRGAFISFRGDCRRGTLYPVCLGSGMWQVRQWGKQTVVSAHDLARLIPHPWHLRMPAVADSLNSSKNGACAVSESLER